jgi:hypothetical protein
LILTAVTACVTPATLFILPLYKPAWLKMVEFNERFGSACPGICFRIKNIHIIDTSSAN